MDNSKKDFSVSIIIPARNEAGTISSIPDLIPKMGKSIELIFVEGNSSDNTWEEILKIKNSSFAKASKDKQISNLATSKSAISHQPLAISQRFAVKAFKQKGRGKADAVNLGFAKATGDILMILDSDLSVNPKDLVKFYDLLASGKADFANGSRFVYTQEKGAMRYFNHLGNKFFALVFSLILRQRITDTLCGTKVLFRNDYLKIEKLTKNFSKTDPYGDFQLLLGAGMLGLKVKEVPIKYRARVYGKSNISPFWDGIKLIILLFKASKEFISSQIPKKK